MSLDDYEGADFLSLWRELEQALQQPDHGILEETTVFRPSTVFETIAPPNLKAVAPPGYFPMRRAGALHFLGEPELALISLKEAYDHRPNDPDTLASYLEILRSIDSHRAESEAKSLALSKDANASVFAACINVWSAAADRLTGPQFDAVIPQILEWFDRFERATGRDQVRAST